MRADHIDQLVHAVVTELRDYGSERRHRQLLEICDREGVAHLPKAALDATRSRLASEAKLGPLDNAGAYYQSVLLRSLQDHQVFVPRIGEDDAHQVREQLRESLGIGRDGKGGV